MTKKSQKRQINIDAATVMIVAFIVFAIIGVICITVKDISIRKACIEAGGNFEFGECKMFIES